MLAARIIGCARWVILCGFIAGSSLALPSLITLRPVCAASAAQPRQRLALLVGISDYSHGTNPADKFPDLNTQPDLLTMRSVLTDQGFESADIRILSDADGTQENIKAQFHQHLIDRARPGDTVLFYFTGHGHQVPAANDPHEPDGLDEVLVTWVPADKQQLPAPERHHLMYLVDDDLQVLLKQLAEKMRGPGDKVEGSITVILDSCHSGSADRGSLIRKGRPWDERVDGPKPPAHAGDVAGGWLDKKPLEGIQFISACESNQSAYLEPIPVGQNQGSSDRGSWQSDSLLG
jgi:hypothetical protein